MECTSQQGGRGIMKQFTVRTALVGVSTNGVPTHSGTSDLHNDFFAVNSPGPDTKREGVIIEQVAAYTILPLTNTLSVPCVSTNSLSLNGVATSCSSQSQCTKDYLKYDITNPPTAQRVTSILDHTTGNLWQLCDVDACNGDTVYVKHVNGFTLLSLCTHAAMLLDGSTGLTASSWDLSGRACVSLINLVQITVQGRSPFRTVMNNFKV